VSGSAAAVNSVSSLLAYTRSDASASGTSLCVSVQRSQSSISRGETAKWIVSVWAQGGSVPGTTVRLSATPASQSPAFISGCGVDGTPGCDVGSVNSTSQQLQAGVSVAASASSVTSVQLTATATAANLASDPTASVTVQVTSAKTALTPNLSKTSALPISVGSLPYISGTAGTRFSFGGNASGLFPSLNPSSAAPGSSGSAAPQRANARPVADTSALPLGTPVVGAQLAGLGALAVGFILAVTRLSVRRRPALKPPAE
jgi:hypothetical protein